MDEAGSKYQNLGQVGAMGDGAKVDVLTQHQSAQSSDLDYPLFLAQLQELRKAIHDNPDVTQDEKDQAIAAIQNAKDAAGNKNLTGVKTSLSRAGGWILSIAEKTGVYLVAGVIKDSLHHS